MRRLWMIVATCALLACCLPGDASAQTLDQYGGVTCGRTPGGATGYFRVAKLGNRWVFVTPTGNPFWLRSVYGIDITDGGGPYVEVLKRKYGSGDWIPWFPFVEHAAKRLKSWNFNAFGEYTSAYAYPIGTYGRRETNPEKLPFIAFMNPTLAGKRNGIKDIQFGVDPAVTPGLWRVEGFPDLFDPGYEGIVKAVAPQTELFPDQEVIVKAPWVIGTTTDDRDYLFGFGPQREFDGWHNHLGWQAAATRPAQTSNPNVLRGSERGITYRETRVFTKYAFRDFLRERYGSLDALNRAWASTYTTWESEGTWPNGKGVLDESGRGAWMGRDFYSLKDTQPKVRADLDDFLGVMADRYFKTVSQALRAARPNHLVLCPASLSARAHAKVLEAAGRHCDVLQIEAPWDTDKMYERVYALAKKPFFIWTTVMGQKDSPLRDSDGWKGVDHPTQQERGRAYAKFIERAFRFRTADGTHPIVGINWWAWTDKVTGGERHNFGLVTNLDNAYDGKAAVVARGKDQWGRPTGGETRDYGDFLSSVTQANVSVTRALCEDGDKK